MTRLLLASLSLGLAISSSFGCTAELPERVELVRSDTLALATLEPGVEIRQIACARSPEKIHLSWTTQIRRLRTYVNADPPCALWYSQLPNGSRNSRIPVQLLQTQIQDLEMATAGDSILIFYTRRDTIVALCSVDDGLSWHSAVLGVAVNGAYANSLGMLRREREILLVASIVTRSGKPTTSESGRLGPGLHACNVLSTNPAFHEIGGSHFLIGDQDKPSLSRGPFGLRVGMMLNISLAARSGQPPPGVWTLETLARPLVLETNRLDGHWRDVTPDLPPAREKWPARSQLVLADTRSERAIAIYSSPSVLASGNNSKRQAQVEFKDMRAWLQAPVATQQIASIQLGRTRLLAWMDYRNQVDEGTNFPLGERLLIDRRRLNNDLRVAQIGGAGGPTATESIQLTTGTPIVSAIGWSEGGGHASLAAAIRPTTTHDDDINVTKCQIVVFTMRMVPKPISGSGL